jgi:hypothetical protein
MFEIWRHRVSGQRFLVIVRDRAVTVAAGPLDVNDDPRRVLETHSNQNHNPAALMHIRRAPDQYLREYTTDAAGHAVAVDG